MSVTAVVPVWNSRDLLTKLLDTIDRQTIAFAEVIAVDNGSSDGVAELAEQRGARVIRLGRNTGFAHAVNLGVQEAKSPKVAILNSDVELAPNWLEHLLASPAPYAVGTIVSAAQPDLLDGAYDLLCRGGCPWRAGHGRKAVLAPTGVDLPPFTALLIDRALFLELGMLDERFESYLEDVDFGLRCAARGIRGEFVPAAVCRHHGSATLGRWNPETVRRIARNQVFLLAKHYPRPLIRRFLWPILVAHTLWGMLAVRHGAGFAWLRGKWEGLGQFATLPASPIPDLEGLLDRHEAEIHCLQKPHLQQTMDAFWRVYFGLCGAKRHRLKR